MKFLWLWQEIHLVFGLYNVIHLAYTVRVVCDGSLSSVLHVLIFGSLMLMSTTIDITEQVLIFLDSLTYGKFTTFELVKFGLWSFWVRQIVLVCRDARFAFDEDRRSGMIENGADGGPYPNDVHAWFAVLIACVGCFPCGY